MKTVAILNLKGGVGKTVTAVNMAAILAVDHKKRVLIVDADSQCNTTEFFGGAAETPDGEEYGTLADVLTPGYDEKRCMLDVQETETRRLDLLAACDALMDLDLTKVEEKAVDPYGLQRFCGELEFAGYYDYVIIDCAPAFNAATTAALLAAQDVIIPIKLDAFSLRGMANLTRQVSNMGRVNPALKVAGLLPTMYYNNPAFVKALVELENSLLPVFKTVIRRSPKVDDMTFAQEPITRFSPRSAAGRDYRRFVAEYLEGGVGRG